MKEQETCQFSVARIIESDRKCTFRPSGYPNDTNSEVIGRASRQLQTFVGVFFLVNINDKLEQSRVICYLGCCFDAEMLANSQCGCWRLDLSFWLVFRVAVRSKPRRWETSALEILKA